MEGTQPCYKKSKLVLYSWHDRIYKCQLVFLLEISSITAFCISRITFWNISIYKANNITYLCSFQWHSFHILIFYITLEFSNFFQQVSLTWPNVDEHRHRLLKYELELWPQCYLFWTLVFIISQNMLLHSSYSYMYLKVD